jgi:hypothetical protein
MPSTLDANMAVVREFYELAFNQQKPAEAADGVEPFVARQGDAPSLGEPG